MWFVKGWAVILELVVLLSEYLGRHIGSVVANRLLANCTLRLLVIDIYDNVIP